MRGIQDSVLKDVQGADNLQRIANLNELGSFLLRCGKPEEAESLFELLYVSCRLQKDESHPVTLNCERNLVAALRAQGLHCDAAFITDNQKLKIQYHSWRQTVIKYVGNGHVVERFHIAAKAYLNFLVRHAHHTKVEQMMERFLEEYSIFRVRVLGEVN
jgi:hypothetical protein